MSFFDTIPEVSNKMDSKPWNPSSTSEQYKDISIPSGSSFSNARITGFGVQFSDTKQNEFDTGIRQAKFGEFDVTAILDKSKEDDAPFVESKTINGFVVKNGTIVNIRLTTNVINSIPTQNIIFTVGGSVQEKAHLDSEKQKEPFLLRYKTYILVGSFIVVAVVGYFIYDKYFK